jgi:hypothetical protein
VTPGIEAWQQRLARIGLIDVSGRAVPGKEADLQFRAGRAARLTRRPGAAAFRAGPTAYDLPAALGKAGIACALTGDAGANLYRWSAGEIWPVLYVEDIARAADAAGLARKEPGSFGMRATVIAFDGVCELGRTVINEVTVGARDQVIIDAYGGIDRMVEQADILTGRPLS